MTRSLFFIPPVKGTAKRTSPPQTANSVDPDSDAENAETTLAAADFRRTSPNAIRPLYRIASDLYNALVALLSVTSTTPTLHLATLVV